MAQTNSESVEIVIGALQAIFKVPGNVLTYTEHNFLKRLQSRLETTTITNKQEILPLDIQSSFQLLNGNV